MKSVIKKTVKTSVKTTKKAIKVKNAEGEVDTTATILVQNSIKYTPKVSVIIPVYNVEEYLRECLDSVVNQTLKEIEIICVDDGSTDSSLEILKEYAKKDNRITIISQKNLHAGVARNAGLSVAKGEYLSFLDSDDFFELNMLEEMYNKAAELQLDISVCNANIYDESEKVFKKAGYILRMNYVPKYSVVFSKKELRENLYQFTNPAVWTKLYKRDFVLKNNLYFQNLYTCNDIGMGLSAIALADRIAVIDKIFVHYRRGSDVQVTKRRGKTAINIVYAYYYIKHHLISNKLDDFINVLNANMKEKIEWELSRCNSGEKKKFKKQAKQLMGNDFKIFRQCFKKDNFIVHFIKHMKDILISKKEKHCDMYESFLYHDIAHNSVLLVEANSFHGECLPGIAKYFIDLGYNVDVILNYKEYTMDPFCNFKDNRLHIFGMSVDAIKKILESDIVEKYEHLYFNSDRITDSSKEQIVSYYKFFGANLKLPEEKVVTMVHTIEKYAENNFSHPAFCGITLSDLPAVKNTDLKVVNTHYFGVFPEHVKNDVVRFVCVGNIESKRKNHSLLFDAIEYLLSKNITNFKIDVIARGGNLEIPEACQQFIEFKGRLDYKDMYEEVNQADYFLTLLDPENQEHDRYLTCGTSGSYQLIYGFKKPCLLCSKFSGDINMLNKTNAVLYSKNADLGQAMQKAIEMSQDDYKKIQDNLQITQQKLYKQSLDNFRELLQSGKCEFNKNTFISLGENCFIRTVLVRHHTKCKRSEGELSFPFDLKVCGIKTVVKLLASDFKGYFNGLSWDGNKKIWINTKLDIMYNHDLDCDTKQKLVSRYAARIENMRNLKKQTGLIFVASSVNPNTKVSDINELYKILKSEYKGMKFVFINISKSELQNIQDIDKNIHYKHIPNPYPNYWGEWYKEEFYNSKPGIAFEKACNAFVRDVACNK